jgi:hypothetical protein
MPRSTIVPDLAHDAVVLLNILRVAVRPAVGAVAHSRQLASHSPLTLQGQGLKNSFQVGCSRPGLFTRPCRLHPVRSRSCIRVDPRITVSASSRCPCATKIARVALPFYAQWMPSPALEPGCRRMRGRVHGSGAHRERDSLHSLLRGGAHDCRRWPEGRLAVAPRHDRLPSIWRSRSCQTRRDQARWLTREVIRPASRPGWPVPAGSRRTTGSPTSAS